jgi:hypothetical protein
MSDTPEFVAEVATGFPAVPLPEYDQTVCIFGTTFAGTYEPRPWGSSADIATEYTSGPAARDGRHLVTRTGLGLLIQRVEEAAPGSYDTIDVSAFTGTAEPAVVATVVPRDEGEIYIRFVTGTTAVGTAGATYYASDDDGRLGATTLFKLGTASRISFADINAAIDFDPPEAALAAFVEELRSDTLDHFAETAGAVHGAADATSGTGVPGTTVNTLALARTCMIALKAAGLLHVVNVSSSIHGAADTTAQTALTAISISLSSTGQQVLTAALAYKAAMFGTGTANSGHTIRITSSIHGAADAVNVIAAATPTAGTINAGDVVRVSTVAPAWGNDQLADAFTALADSDHDPSMLLISGRVLPANLPTISTGLDALEAAGKRCTVVTQARKRADGETEADWRAALEDEWDEALDYRVAVCAGDGLATFTNGAKTLQYARGFSTQAMRRLMQIERYRTAWEVELGRLEDFTISDANGIVIGHDEGTSPGLKTAQFWTVYRAKSSLVGRVAFLNFDMTRYEPDDRVRSVRVNRITNRMIIEIQTVGLGLLGKTYDVKRTSPTTGTLSQAAIDAIIPKFAAPIINGFQNDISDWNAADLITVGQLVTIDPQTDAFDLVVTVNYTPKLPVGRVSATFAVRLGV